MSASARTIDVAAVKASAHLQLIVAETLALAKDGKEFKAPCPFHNERTPSFTVYQTHYHCFGCGAHGDVIDWLVNARRMTFHDAVDYVAGGGSGHVVHADRPKPSAANDRRNADLARRIWHESCLPKGSLVEDYLHSRGLALPDQDPPGSVIRFHPSCPCGPGRRLPAMVALMTEPLSGDACGIHRTFLQPDGSGKADIPKNQQKMMQGRAAVIRLCERITNGLGIAEGIETALAVAQRFEWGPVWAAGSKDGIRKFPPLVETTLNIFVDNDDPNAIKAANECSARWVAAGSERPFIHLPLNGEDWADAARRLAP